MTADNDGCDPESNAQHHTQGTINSSDIEERRHKVSQSLIRKFASAGFAIQDMSDDFGIVARQVADVVLADIRSGFTAL
jgi:hypothetical protein